MTERLAQAHGGQARRRPPPSAAHVLARRLPALRAVPAPRAMPALAARAHAHTHLVNFDLDACLALALGRRRAAAAAAAGAILRGCRGAVARLERLDVRDHRRGRTEAPPARRTVPRRHRGNRIRQGGHGRRGLERAAGVVCLDRPRRRRVRAERGIDGPRLAHRSGLGRDDWRGRRRRGCALPPVEDGGGFAPAGDGGRVFALGRWGAPCGELCCRLHHALDEAPALQTADAWRWVFRRGCAEECWGWV